MSREPRDDNGRAVEWKVTLADLDYGEEEVRAVTEVLRSRWLTMGELTRQFEGECAAALGARHAVAVTSGTAALELALRALGIGPGDDVLLPSFTFVACANAVLAVGAHPVFVEVEGPEWPTISADDARRKVGPRSRAVMAVHYGGYPCRLDELVSLCREKGLHLLEDAAHSPGAAYEGRFLGTWGRAGCLSFFSNKNLAVGEGGVVITDEEALAQEVRLLRSHGMTTLTWDRHRGHAAEYDVVRAGHNYRPSEMAAALGRVQLGKMKRFTRRRREVVEHYRRGLGGVGGLSIPFAATGSVEATCTPAYHLFPVLLDDGHSRAGFRESLRRAGIQTSIHYPPIHLFSFYRERFGLREGDLPVTEDIARREVTLPLHSRLTDEQVELVLAAVREALG